MSIHGSEASVEGSSGGEGTASGEEPDALEEEGVLSVEASDAAEESSDGAIGDNELTEVWEEEGETEEDKTSEDSLFSDWEEREDDGKGGGDSREASPGEGEADVQAEKSMDPRARKRRNRFICYLPQYFFS